MTYPAMHLWLTKIYDDENRDYAKSVNPDDGEDAYHNAIESLLRCRPHFTPDNPGAFLRDITKRAMYKVWRQQKSSMIRDAAYLMGDGPQHVLALKNGRLPHTHCRRGHEFTPDNIVYMDKAKTIRTCKTCYKASRKVAK